MFFNNKTEETRDMFNMARIGANIMKARKAKGLTQMALADELGISFQAVSNWERGQSCPDIAKLGELSQLLEVSIDELLGNRRAAEITKELEPSTGWTRHTVITLLKRMQEKGSISVDESGNVKRYTPRVSREEASKEQTQKLLRRVFSGKASLLIHNLIDSGEMTMEELKPSLDLVGQL